MLWLVAGCLLSFSQAAVASGGGGQGGGSEPIKLTVNLGDPGKGGRYLQLEMVPEASPEVLATLGHHKPKVLHEIILLLSSEDASRLLTVKGKTDLADRIAAEMNRIIKESPKHGVQDVLFVNFIIQ